MSAALSSNRPEFRKILVVDDSELLHRLYDVIFMRYRHKGTMLLHAMNGQEAFDVLGQHADVDLILLDIAMPVLNGLEFLRQRKEKATADGIPVIVISAEGHEDDTIRALRAGAQAYVKKPFQPSDLHAMVERVAAAKPN